MPHHHDKTPALPHNAASPERVLGLPWHRGIPRLQAVFDVAAILIALAAAQLLRFGGHGFLEGAEAVSYTAVSVMIGVGWWLALRGSNTRDIRIFAVGNEEYKRIARTTLYLFGIVAITSYVLMIDTARGYVALALPTGLALLLAFRLGIRRVISRRRAQGRYLRRIMIIGTPGSVEVLAETLTSTSHAGYLPVAAMIPGYPRRSPTGEELSLPVAPGGADVESIMAAAEDCGAEAIAISNGAHLSPRTTRRLGWEMQERGISMIMAPSLLDVAGPRIHTQPLAGLPLMHVSTPEFTGTAAAVKRTFDVVAASCGLVVLTPLLLCVALAIRTDSPGPVLFRQQRVGRDGALFSMLKFRSMVADAEARGKQLAADAGRDNAVLFKMRRDPRITRVGRVIRRFSIDELPQLLNVVRGEMSLVGPRPPLQSEVAQYDDRYLHRRFMVQPGITGLWQVSGRADLSWEDSVRLDLSYVENWSLLQDMLILAKTVRAVATSRGAY